MRDETKIAPALSVEEWASVQSGGDLRLAAPDTEHEEPSAWANEQGFMGADRHGYAVYVPHAATIALANAALPLSDPRKITRERIEEVKYGAMFAREMGAHFREMGDETVAANREWFGRNLDTFADALASYLPPEGT
jgi:hypothetical protein